MYLRITFNRKKAEMRLNVEINQQELSKWDEVTMRFADRSMAANAYLNSIEKGFEDFKYHNASTLNTYNIRTIRSIVMGMDQTPAPLIMHYVDKYYSKAIAANAQMTEGTKRNYRKAFTHLKNFLVFRKSKDASLKDFNIGFAFEFKDYLLGTHPNTERIGMSEPSALDNIKRLRTVFDRAVDEELLVSNPLKKIKLKAKAPQRGRLDINQVRDIYKLNLQDFPTQQLYKDMFLFSIFTGLLAQVCALITSPTNDLTTPGQLSVAVTAARFTAGTAEAQLTVTLAGQVILGG